MQPGERDGTLVHSDRHPLVPASPSPGTRHGTSLPASDCPALQMHKWCLVTEENWKYRQGTTPIIVLSSDAADEDADDEDEDDVMMATNQKLAVLQAGLNSGQYQGKPTRCHFPRNQNQSQRWLCLTLGKNFGETSKRGCRGRCQRTA